MINEMQKTAIEWFVEENINKFNDEEDLIQAVVDEFGIYGSDVKYVANLVEMYIED